MKQIFISFLILVSFRSSSQNVGVGTLTPRVKLEVAGVAGSGNTSAIFGTDGAGISLQQNWPTIGFNQYRDAPTLYGKYMAAGYAASLYFDPSAGNYAIDMLNTGPANINTPSPYRALTILSNGNVGIRTASPQASLSVARGDGYEGTAVFAGFNYWTHFNYSFAEDTYIRAGRSGGIVYLNHSVPNGNVLIGNGSAYIGIGMTSPAATINISLPFPATTDLFRLENSYSHAWSQQMVMYQLPTEYPLYFKYQGTDMGYFQPSNGQYVLFSDSTIKKNILPMDAVLDKIKALRPVRYTMVNDNPEQKKSLGFIAQEVKPVFPGLVRVIDNDPRMGVHYTDLHTMSYTGFSVIAVKALQEQYEEIKELEAETAELMERLRRVQEKMQKKAP